MMRPISVLFPEPLEPTSAVVEPAGAWKETCFSTGTPGLYSKVTSSNATSPRTSATGARLGVLGVLGLGTADFADAIEAGEGLGDLRSDRGELDHRRRHETGEEEVHDEVAERHAAREDRAAADHDHQHADHADDHGRERGDPRDRGHGARDVAKQAVCAGGEGALLPALGGIGLDDAHPAQRLGEPSGELGIELAALAEQRADALEGERHDGAEDGEDGDVDEGEPPVEVEQHGERAERGDHAAGELHEPGADQVPDALGVVHDARDQDAALS